DARERLLEVDDVDAVPLHEDEALHLRVPTARLVPEVDPGLQELLHGYNGHVGLPFSSASVSSPGVAGAPGARKARAAAIGKACVISGETSDPIPVYANWHARCRIASDVAKYDETPVPRGTSHRWEVLMAVDEQAERPRRDRRTALEVRHDHRVLQDLAADLLRQMPLVPDGARLTRRGEYLDLHDPGRADFRALGDEVVRPGQRLIARSDVSTEAWRALLDGCDRVVGRRHLPRSA